MTVNHTWCIIPYITGELLFHRKNIGADGHIVEMKIWKVSAPGRKPPGLKYSLVYIRDGVRVIGYDNAEDKGPHKHYRGREHPYDFGGIDKLIKDFYDDVRKAQRGEL